MITGSVSADRKPMVPLRVRGPAGTVLDVMAVMDTGFTGSLALPASAAAALGLHTPTDANYELADGKPVTIPPYAADVEWGAGWRTVRVLAIGREPLLGMALLEGYRVYMEVVAGGLVDIHPLP